MKKASRNGKSSATPKYFVNIAPLPEADLELGLAPISARIKPDWMYQSDLIGLGGDLPVATFEEMIGG